MPSIFQRFQSTVSTQTDVPLENQTIVSHTPQLLSCSEIQPAQAALTARATLINSSIISSYYDFKLNRSCSLQPDTLEYYLSIVGL